MSYGMASPMAGPNGKVGNKIPKGYSTSQVAQYTPEQMQLFQQGLGNVGPQSYLSRLAGGDQELFNQIEAPAMQQYAGLQGNLASRFSGAGGGFGARKSSGFQNEAGNQASNFALNLQAQRQQLQHQATMDLHNMSQQLLGNRPYETSLVKKQQKEGVDWLGLGAAGLGAAGGFFVGGPAGAAAGAGIGYNTFGRNGQGTSNADVQTFANNYL